MNTQKIDEKTKKKINIVRYSNEDNDYHFCTKGLVYY